MPDLPESSSPEERLSEENRSGTGSSARGRHLPPVDRSVLIKLVRNHYPIERGPQFGPYRKRSKGPAGRDQPVHSSNELSTEEVSSD